MVAARSCAHVGIFVKTKGLTPLKTRLAQSIGAKAANEFYDLAIDCVCETLLELAQKRPEVASFFAVSEPLRDVQHYWRTFPLLWQGDGDLAARLFSIYQQLTDRGGKGVLIGADAPQIPLEYFEQALDSSQDVVIGPAKDGGFYLFASSKPLSLEFWQSIPYSCETTFTCLAQALDERNLSLEFLPPLTDVDYEEDLSAVASECRPWVREGSSLKALSEWLRSYTP